MSASTGTKSPSAPAQGERSAARTAGNAGRWWWPGAAVVAAGVFVVAAFWGGAIDRARLVGLPDAGAMTTWGLPAMRVVADLAGAAAVGLCLTAAFLLPGSGRTIGPHAYRILRRAGPVAFGLTVSALAQLGLSASDLLGQPMSQLSLTTVVSFTTAVSQGQALAVQAVLAAVTGVLAFRTLSRAGAAWCAALALASVLPPAFTGHAAGEGNHQIAVTSLALHVLAASVWLGGLIALLSLRTARGLGAVAARYSRLALWCFVAVLLSGLANAWVRVGSWQNLWHSRYGTLVVAKVVALVALGLCGAAHRAWTLRRLSAGRPRAFLRLAAGETVLFTSTFALAVALSRSPTPTTVNADDFDPYTSIVGFERPPPPTAALMLGQPLPDLFFLTLITAGTIAYLSGALRLHRRGDRWPWQRTACWLGGMAILAAVTNLGFARYAYVLFSAHMAQHMILSMVVPVLLVRGAPVTLALRATRRPTEAGVWGPRDWLLTVLHGSVLRMLTHPVAALAIYLAGLFGLYFSNLLSILMRDHLGHLVMLTHFLLSGCLLFWVIIGVDPGRRRLAPPILILVHLAAMGFHAFFGVALMQAQTLIAGDWYQLVSPYGAASALADQRVGAGIAWAFGEIPATVILLVLFAQWIRTDERDQRRIDRAAERAAAAGEPDAHDQYNAFLRRLAEQDGRSRSSPP